MTLFVLGTCTTERHVEVTAGAACCLWHFCRQEQAGMAGVWASGFLEMH